MAMLIQPGGNSIARIAMQRADAPNFFILGGAKCGTTTLHFLLRQHPEIFLTDHKEPNFFGEDTYFRKGLDAYLSTHFKGAAHYRVRGEATTRYLHAGREVALRVRETLGEELKFVALFRDPVQRAWSHYLNMVRFAAEDLPFEQALAAEPARQADPLKCWHGYFADGLYAHQLQQWLEVYPRERFLLFLTDDLQKDPHSVSRSIFEFLGVDERFEIDAKPAINKAAAPRYKLLGVLLNRRNRVTDALKHVIPYEARQRIRVSINRWNERPFEQVPQLEPRVQHTLRKRYRDDIKQLEVLLGRDLSPWLKGEGFLPSSENQ